MKIIHYLLAVIFAVGAVNAQDAPKETPHFPPGPLVPKLADYDSWQIDFSIAKKPAATGDGSATAVAPVADIFTSENRQVTITQTKPLWHVEIVKASGAKIEQWGDGVDQFMETPGSGAYLDNQIAPGGISTLIEFKNGNLPDLSWVTAEYYVGEQPLGQQKCYTFSNNVATAWIDKETRLPVAWRSGTETRLFKRLEPPNGPIQMPPKVLKIKEAMKADIKRLTTPYRPRG